MFRVRAGAQRELLPTRSRMQYVTSRRLSLVLEGNELCMSISDDGQGFVVDSGRPTSFGLVGMRERVLIMGGSLDLHSEQGEGTSLTVRVPLDP